MTMLDARRALMNLRSGVDRDTAVRDLVESGRTAVAPLIRELAMQPRDSVFSGVLLLTLAKIAADQPHAISHEAMQVIHRDVAPFVPRIQNPDDLHAWIVERLHPLGLQVLRSRYLPDDQSTKRALDGLASADIGVDPDQLIDVLGGSLDHVPEQKQVYVERIVGFMETTANVDVDMAVAIAKILAYFGPLARSAVPCMTELLAVSEARETRDTAHTLTLLACLEHVGHAARVAMPTILKVLRVDSDALMGQDALVMAVMGAVGGIGVASDEVCRMLSIEAKDPAAIIQSRARETLWKLCLE